LATDPADVRASILRVFGNQPPPAARRLAHDTDTALADVATELQAAHDRLIAPSWPRMLALLEVDIAHRAAHLAARGPAALLNELHPSIRWTAGKLAITQPRGFRRIQLGAGGLVLCPSVLGGPVVAVKHRTSSQTTLRYPARGLGTLWTATTDAPSSALDQLVGRPRARVLRALSSPATTTLLAREHGVTASAVSQHLTVLHANGLVGRHRTGRHVHYVLSDSGRALVRPSGSDTEAP
jgi:DNA-binding transcriptional ArsR family regulator